MSVDFGTKAETLAQLARLNTRFHIPALLHFSAADWEAEAGAVLERVARRFGHCRAVAVRSSAQGEDGAECSMAGAFTSRLDVDPRDQAAVRAAVEETLASYAGNPRDQVLVQQMVEDVDAAGVIFTHGLGDGSPYYVLSYDDASGRTDAVTGGKGEHKTVYVFRGVDNSHFDSVRVVKMVNLARELESIFGSVPLDIEFSIDTAGRVHLLQVRRLCAVQAGGGGAHVYQHLPGALAFVEQCSRPRRGLAGERTVLSNMADWNPAEMIGAFPRPLAASLYRSLITRRVWAAARARMGYRALPAQELMVLLCGRPYIDVRASFNSFLPRDLPEDTAGRLVEAWLERLRRSPELHDKVEFQVAQTVKDFTFAQTCRERYGHALTGADVAAFDAAATDLSNSCLRLSGGPLDEAEARIAGLGALQAVRGWPALDEGDPRAMLCLAADLLAECRRLGTLPFAMLARCAFMSEALLRSAVARGALAPERVARLKQSVRTVTRELSEDFRAVFAGTMPSESFMDCHGHLRPGTYDIVSPCYRHRADFFEACTPGQAPPPAEAFRPTGAELKALDALLAEAGITSVDAHGLFAFVDRAVRGRELGKHLFTRNLSQALEALAAWGRAHGLSREDMSHQDIDELLSGLASSQGAGARHAARAAESRAWLAQAGSLKLSYLIRGERDLYVVPMHRSVPNFITARRVQGPVALLGSVDRSGVELAGRVVCIENADPGFDWIFTQGIAGLVTKYGGANSHMAIRAAEFGIPAAIGCGEQAFEAVSGARAAEIDCAAQTLRAV